MELIIIIQLILENLIATTAMTLFSYAISKTFHDQYKEPVLLSYVIDNIPTKNSFFVDFTGWLIHYIIGFLFISIYHFLWSQNIILFSFYSALVFGIISGMIGIFSWMLIFKISNKEPKINYTIYYTQLLIAHIIFALTAALLYFYLSNP